MPQPIRPDRNDAPWTSEDYKASHNLTNLWNLYAPSRSLTQNKAAKLLGISQPAISNYLNGVLKLNIAMVLHFALLLGVEPSTIDPRLSNLMKLPKPEYTHGIRITTSDYEPRVYKGDTVVPNPERQPKPSDLCIAFTYNKTQYHIGFFKDPVTLIHPITKEEQSISPDLVLQPINAIIPGNNQ